MGNSNFEHVSHKNIDTVFEKRWLYLLAYFKKLLWSLLDRVQIESVASFRFLGKTSIMFFAVCNLKARNSVDRIRIEDDVAPFLTPNDSNWLYLIAQRIDLA